MEPKNMKFSTISLAVFLLLKIVLLIFFSNLSEIDLGPDEAQYWTWSQHLDFGYYSKPPGIAWLIALGITILGNTAWGVRSVALALGVLLPLMAYRLAKKSGLQENSSLAAAWTIACIPVGFLASLFATTDAPYIFCWIGALTFLAEGLTQKKSPRYLPFALWIAVGALFKWPIFYLWAFALLGAYFYPTWRSRKLFTGLLISLIGLLPSLYWNINHDWATFRHVSATVMGGSVAVAKGNIGDFLGAQAILLFPLLFIMLIPAFIHLWKHRTTAPPAVFFLSVFSALALGLFTLLSIKQKMQGNWALFTVPGFILLLSWYLMERLTSGRKILIGSLACSFTFCCAALLVPYLGSKGPFSISYYKLNPFRHNMGWHEIGPLLTKHGYEPNEDFLFSDTYQNVSELYFYGPQQKRSYFLNLQGRRKNQFSYWPTMEQEQQGKTGYFLWIENSPKWQQHYHAVIENYTKILDPLFDHVELVGVEPIGKDADHSVKGLIIFKCIGFKGSSTLHEVQHY